MLKKQLKNPAEFQPDTDFCREPNGVPAPSSLSRWVWLPPVKFPPKQGAWPILLGASPPWVKDPQKQQLGNSWE